MTEYALEHLRGYDKIVIPDSQYTVMIALLDKIMDSDINNFAYGALRETKHELAHLTHETDVELRTGIVLHTTTINCRHLLYIDNPRLCPYAYDRGGNYDEDNLFADAAAGDTRAYNAIF